jgi:translation initiation factor 5B
MKEMRVKGEFLHHNSVFAANGVKIAATGLDCAVAGGSVFLTKTE